MAPPIPYSTMNTEVVNDILLTANSDFTDSFLCSLYGLTDAQILRLAPEATAAEIRAFLPDLKGYRAVAASSRIYRALAARHENLVLVPAPELVWKNPKQYQSRIEAILRGIPSLSLKKGITRSIAKDEHELTHWLKYHHLHEPMLAVDIETTGLSIMECEILSIAIASRTSGVSIAWSTGVADVMRDFFAAYTGICLYHNISFDASVLVRELFMKHPGNNPGMLAGMEQILKNWDDTKLITWLCTNSCQQNELSLKKQAQEYLGDYGLKEIKNASSIPIQELLQYNMNDCLATWYVYDKYRQQLVADGQEEIYHTLLKPAVVDIVQMQLTGIPVNREKVATLEYCLKQDTERYLAAIRSNPHSYADFNPASSQQIAHILYEKLRLPILNQTAKGKPSTDRKTLQALVDNCADEEVRAFIQALLDRQATRKIATTFLPILKNTTPHSDGVGYIHGHFNLGGTVTGRLSSSNPNLQNLPATGTTYAGLFKECIAPPQGWVWLGADFSSLEDKISALTTKDPAKLKVYEEGYDGHCLRAFYYFREHMPDIEETVESINSIKHKYPQLRQKSKAPTFALTYAGTWRTLVQQCGFIEQEAKQIEAAYHRLYSVSDAWVKERIALATRQGYVTAAFGLRVRTPVLQQTILDNRATPFAAASEARTAGNALGQSWCLLNTRAFTEVMEKVRASEFCFAILPCAQIHDAMYFLVKDKPEIVAFARKAINEAMLWQNHPDISHPRVFLGGDTTLYRTSWNHPEKE